jgi:hypothetical protein
MWDYRAKITNVHDGDTVTAVLDRGFGDMVEIQVRLFGTFAPELAQTGGADTRDYAAAWIAARQGSDPEAWPFIVTSIRNKVDTREIETLGRYVCLITDPQGECLNTAVSAYVQQKGYPGGTGSPTASGRRGLRRS